LLKHPRQVHKNPQFAANSIEGVYRPPPPPPTEIPEQNAHLHPTYGGAVALQQKTLGGLSPLLVEPMNWVSPDSVGLHPQLITDGTDQAPVLRL